MKGPSISITEKLKVVGQEHLLSRWPELTVEEQSKLVAFVQETDFERISKIYKKSTAPSDQDKALPLPVTNVNTRAARSKADIERWQTIGLEQIAAGKLALVLLAGGQGTRLGSSDPKGCFCIGLPSNKSLFQLQAERIRRVQQLAAEANPSPDINKVVIPWYIMTSPFTDTQSQDFFRHHDFFGLSPSQVFFFQQGTLPCLTKDGRIILESPCKVAQAPDGNGGVYAALKASGCLADMLARGVHYVDCYSVDNALVRVADPLFLGFCTEAQAACAAKVVKKAYPEEKVGVFVQRGAGGPTAVMEYSELSPEVATSTDESGALRFGWSNICLHMFSVPFLQSAIAALERDSQYHVAVKSIPSVDGPVTGVKLEQFIFDVFPYAESMVLFEVTREQEFAPVKNSAGSPTDSPDTARKLLLRLHASWLKAAGASLTDSDAEQGLEVSPLISYSGEGLESMCRGCTFTPFFHLSGTG